MKNEPEEIIEAYENGRNLNPYLIKWGGRVDGVAELVWFLIVILLISYTKSCPLQRRKSLNWSNNELQEVFLRFD